MGYFMFGYLFLKHTKKQSILHKLLLFGFLFPGYLGRDLLFNLIY